MSKPIWAGSYDPVEFAEKTGHLAACPACSEADTLTVDKENDRERWFVLCYNCGHEGPIKSSPLEARKAYNQKCWED